jgi:hypothetical protein
MSVVKLPNRGDETYLTSRATTPLVATYAAVPGASMVAPRASTLSVVGLVNPNTLGIRVVSFQRFAVWHIKIGHWADASTSLQYYTDPGDVLMSANVDEH